jgi:hypothetical protein
LSDRREILELLLTCLKYRRPRSSHTARLERDFGREATMNIAESFIHPTVSALPRGLPLLRHPLLNKGTAFTRKKSAMRSGCAVSCRPTFFRSKSKPHGC